MRRLLSCCAKEQMHRAATAAPSPRVGVHRPPLQSTRACRTSPLKICIIGIPPVASCWSPETIKVRACEQKCWTGDFRGNQKLHRLPPPCCEQTGDCYRSARISASKLTLCRVLPNPVACCKEWSLTRRGEKRSSGDSSRESLKRPDAEGYHQEDVTMCDVDW